MYLLLVSPFVFVIDVLLWICGASRRTCESFDRGLSRYDQMLQHCYPTGTVPTIVLSTFAGYGVAALFGNDLPEREHMNFAGCVQFGGLFALAVLVICVIAAIGTAHEYCTDDYYRPTDDMLGIWTLGFCSSVMTVSFAAGYFFVPALI